MILTRRFPINLFGYLALLGRRARQKNTLYTEMFKLGRLLKPGAVCPQSHPLCRRDLTLDCPFLHLCHKAMSRSRPRTGGSPLTFGSESSPLQDAICPLSVLGPGYLIQIIRQQGRKYHDIQTQRRMITEEEGYAAYRPQQQAK